MATRELLNTTPGCKRPIDEAYEPHSPPGPESPRQGNLKSASPPRPTQDDGDKAGTTENTMDVEKTTVEDVPSAGAAATQSEGVPPSLDEDDRDDISTTSTSTAKPPTEDANPDPKGKGKAKAVDPEDDTPEKFFDVVDPDMNMLFPDDESSEDVYLERFPPQPRGWGRDSREDFLHTVPKSHGGLHKKRAVFRYWPRSPKGLPIIPGVQSGGTLSPDGFPWGATLYDFYIVNRVPGFDLAISYMTGSTLLHTMRALDEFDAAGPEIEWALSESKPRDEGVADTQELIYCTEHQIHLMGLHNFSVSQGDGSGSTILEEKGDEQAPENDSDGKKDNNDMNVDPASTPPQVPLNIPVTSPFHPSHYPKPWPLVPFEKSSPVLLQERIPLYLLPQTLHVHDPFNLLSTQDFDPESTNTSWNSRPDIIRTYKLRFSESVLKETEEARKKAEKLEEFKARTLTVLRYKRTKEQIENHEPIIEVPLPPYSRRKTRTEEGHLYLSPVAKVGGGDHSIVYKAEWELPRDLFMRPQICPECFKESVDKEIQRLKETGRWEKLLRAASWGPTGFTGRLPTEAEMKEVGDPANLSEDEKAIEREIVCIVPPDTPPSQISEEIDERNVWDIFMTKKKQNTAILDFAKMWDPDGDDSNTNTYVASIRIDPPFSHESQKTCTHGTPIESFPTPRTAMFSVIAKLSLEDDPHLAKEASNYQNFPERFFHHYDGYTIMSQMRTVVPVHAIVPQFYGYYKPKKIVSKKGKQKRGPYLSPILLLEHCGVPIDSETLSLEDQEECVSMVLRFQRAGWLHESLAARNFLVQVGKPTEFPLQREAFGDLSFRMIDFGRSRKYRNAGEKRAEEMVAMKMFDKLRFQMAVTLRI